MLGLLIYKKIRLNYKNLFVNFAKMMVAGVVTFAICVFASELFNTFELPKYVFETIKILSVGALCLIVYTLLNILLKMDYVMELVKRLVSKTKSTN